MGRILGEQFDPLLVRIKQGGYITYADRCAVYEIFKMNGDNIRETSRQTGLHQNTVRRYVDQVVRQAESEVNAERTEYAIAVREEVHSKMMERETQFISDASTIKQKALDLIKDKLDDKDKSKLIPLKDITGTLKVLHEITTGKIITDQESKEIENKPRGVAMEQAFKAMTLIQQNITIKETKRTTKTKKNDKATKKPATIRCKAQ